MSQSTADRVSKDSLGGGFSTATVIEAGENKFLLLLHLDQDKQKCTMIMMRCIKPRGYDQEFIVTKHGFKAVEYKVEERNNSSPPGQGRKGWMVRRLRLALSCQCHCGHRDGAQAGSSSWCFCFWRGGPCAPEGTNSSQASQQPHLDTVQEVVVRVPTVLHISDIHFALTSFTSYTQPTTAEPQA